MNNIVAHLLEEFDEAAQDWGWQRDQGCGASVDKFKDAYDETKAELAAYIEDMSRAINRLEAPPRRTPCVAVVGKLVDANGRVRAFRYLFESPFEMADAICTIQVEYMPGSRVLVADRESV